jgi:hypothetical protein
VPLQVKYLSVKPVSERNDATIAKWLAALDVAR